MLVASPKAVQCSGSWGCVGSRSSPPASALPHAPCLTRSLRNEDKRKTPTNGLKTHGFLISFGTRPPLRRKQIHLMETGGKRRPGAPPESQTEGLDSGSARDAG